MFSHDPHLLAGTTKNGDDLWEDVLNSFLKNALGWGGEEDTEGMVEPTGRSKRKRQAFAIGDLRTCILGLRTVPYYGYGRIVYGCKRYPF